MADVVKEYLHLTATAVKIKHPKVTTIASEELIKKVSQFSFWEYHDHMVRIMELEEKKLEAKQKKEEEEKQLAAMKEKQLRQSQQNTGILGKFRNFWRGGSSNNTNSSRDSRNQSMLVQKNKNGGLVASSNARNVSHSVGDVPSAKSGFVSFVFFVSFCVVFWLLLNKMCGKMTFYKYIEKVEEMVRQKVANLTRKVRNQVKT